MTYGDPCASGHDWRPDAINGALDSPHFEVRRACQRCNTRRQRFFLPTTAIRDVRMWQFGFEVLDTGLKP